MRLIFLLLILINCNPLFSNEWEMIDNNSYIYSRNGHEFEFFMSRPIELNNTIFAKNVATSESIIYSKDNCMNWDTSLYAPLNNIGASTRFYDLVTNGKSIFVPADSGRLYRSFDNGQTWDYHLFENDIHPIQHINFVNENVGFVGIIFNHLLSKTTDGGKTWNSLPIVGDAVPEVFSFVRFSASDENNIIIVGFDLTVTPTEMIFLETTNGGNSWHRFESEEFEASQYISDYYPNLTFHNGNFIVEYRFKDSELAHTSLYRSKDFRTWEPIFLSDTIGGSKKINQLKFYDNVGIAMGSKSFFVSNDDGNTWIDLYDKNDTIYFDKAQSVGFVYIDDYVYSQGFIQYIDDEGLKRNKPKIFRYKLDFQKSSVEMELSSLKVYPNPAKSEINIEYNNIESIELLNINGKCLIKKENSLNTFTNTLNIENINPGTYFLKINNKVYRKIVVE